MVPEYVFVSVWRLTFRPIRRPTRHPHRRHNLVLPATSLPPPTALDHEAHRSPMTALAVHKYAPLLASGSHNQFIKVFNTQGETLNMIRYHDGFLGQVRLALDFDYTS